MTAHSSSTRHPAVALALFALASTCAIVIGVSGCGGGSGAAPSTVAPPLSPSPIPSIAPTGSPTTGPSSGKINHVIIIIQENRSFDNLFHGFPGADYATTGQMHDGTVVTLQPLAIDNSSGGDPGHRRSDALSAIDGGRMDGFDLEKLFNGQSVGGFVYSFVPQTQVQPYWDMATQFTLADRMFSSAMAPSYVQHQYLIAGQSANVDSSPDGYPWGCDAPSGTTTTVVTSSGDEVTGPFPCFTYTTLADYMDSIGITWKYYTPGLTSGWEAYEAIARVRYGPDWSAKIAVPESSILSDIGHGSLPQVSWVVPRGVNSDHPTSTSSTGPAWVSSIVNAVGGSSYWNDTAIFVVWDEWGGWYDHVVPQQLDRMGLGPRVPLIVISPYAKHGYVSHVTHEWGSILRFTEETFLIPSMGATDARADDLRDCFDFSQAVAPLQPIHTSVRPSYFLRQPATAADPPDAY